jgi:hypothetical protein
MTTETSPFDPTIDTLPSTLPIFPLQGVLLLPGGKLPLNIFEPRYLEMVKAALGESRMIGMVQPAIEDNEATGFEVEAALEDVPVEDMSEGAASDMDPGAAPIYRVGCAGRISQFSETDDGRFLITLKGVVRFRIRRELVVEPGGFRRVVPDFNPFATDLEAAKAYFDRQRLLEALNYYFDQQGIEADWDTIREASNERLVTSLAMVCPFSSAEKQALLEAPTPSDRAETMTTIMEMAVLGTGAQGTVAARH